MAIERRAVDLAIVFLKEQGYVDVDDVGDKKSHDLEARRDDELMLVEVKGTTTVGAEVVLTKNEVDVYSKAHPATMIAIVSGIVLHRGKEPSATGGYLRSMHPWEIALGALTPISYRYRVPSGEA